MRNKLFWVVVGVALIVCALYFWPTHNNPVQSSNPAEAYEQNIEKPLGKASTSEKETILNNESSVVDSNEVSSAATLDDWQSEILQQLVNRRYSEDTHVELISIAMEFEGCGNHNLSWMFHDLSLTDKQQTILKGTEKRCNELEKKYPFLLEKNVINNDMRLVINLFPANTAMGQYFQEQAFGSDTMEIDSFVKGLIPLAIRDQNSQMLFMAGWAIGLHRFVALYPESLFNGQDREYFRTIQQISLTSISCQFQQGVTCGPTGEFMLNKCFDDEQFCGLDFDQWYQLAVTPGMDADIKILQQYFMEQAHP